MKDILLFPGAFNPPHYGHASLVEIALKHLSFDEVWIMPSGKRDDKNINTSYEDRRALGDLFVQYLSSKVLIPVVFITAELDNQEGKYTPEIIKEIKSQKDAYIIQLIGLDGFLSLRKKADPSEKFVVVPRPGYFIPDDFVQNNNVIILENRGEDISSTQIRNMIRDNDPSYKKLLPDTIVDYMESHNLYR